MKLGKAFRNIAVLGALAALLGGFPAQAAEYPTKEIRIIQPYPSGGFNDVVTRKMAEVIAQDQLLSKDILAVAITGANTRNALQTVLDAAPDGYTLLMHHTALVATKVSGQLPIGYTDFEMLGGLCAGPIAIDVMKDSPWTEQGRACIAGVEELGVKSGQGFYDYSGDKADEAIRERDRMYIELAKVLYFNKK